MHDYVLINLSIFGARLGLIGFNTGARQFGAVKYIDGLWLWNGDMGPNLPQPRASISP